MPFVSKAQQRFMYAKHPKIAQEFASKTPNIAQLPEKKTSSQKKNLAMKARAMA